MTGNVQVSVALAKYLKDQNVKYVFGQSIPSAFHLAAGDESIRQIVYRTENAGAAMADGFTRISNSVGIITAQNGPAATLLVPGLAEAYKSSVPVIALVQDVPAGITDKNAFQELDQMNLFHACAKWVKRCADPNRVEEYFHMAMTAATTGRPGPVVLIVPINTFVETANTHSHRDEMVSSFPLDRIRPDPSRVRQVAEKLAKAERPLLVVGGGVHLSGATAALRRLQDAFHLPVATSVNGKGAVDEFHELSIGIVGNAMGRYSAARHMRPILNKADFILFVGTRTSQNGTDSWTLFPKTAEYAQLDIDGLEVGRNYESIRLVGDAKLGLEDIADAMSSLDLSSRVSSRRAFAEEIAAGWTRHQDETADLMSTGSAPVRPERVMRDAAKQLTDDSVVVADASYSSIWVANYLRARGDMRFVSPRGLAGLGWGLPLAIGAKVASPRRDVLCFVGDGGFGHVWSELETARRLQLNIPITVFNNSVLGFQREAENIKFNRHTIACHFHKVDHAAIAQACGCEGVTVTHPDEYTPALAAALKADVPTLIDVITDEAAFPPVTIFDVLYEREQVPMQAEHFAGALV